MLNKDLNDSAICTFQMISPPLDDFIRPEDLNSKSIIRHNLQIGSPMNFQDGVNEDASPVYTDRALPHSPLTQF